MKLLLTGPPRGGKSTLLRRLAEAFPGHAGGIITTEILDQDRRRAGFELHVVWNPPSGKLTIVDRALLAHLTQPLPLQVGRYHVNPDAIGMAVRALDAAMHESGLVLIDEIGPLQSLSPDFRDAVLRCLDGPCRLLGTLAQAGDPFVDYVRARPGVRVLEVTRFNRQHLADGLLPWVRGQAR